MSYVELGDVLFRGELVGANGEARFKLTADAIDAVDTINIQHGQVSYILYSYQASKYVNSGGVINQIVCPVTDSDVVIQVDAYGHLAGQLRFNGGNRPMRLSSHVNKPLFSYSELFQVNPGTHTVQIVSGSAGTSTKSWILVKYLRLTGSDNV
ncbi:MAG: hypothetical protein B0D91_10560 [Oceanospirillales bacterium LUC14_002_19_P2]|nr:MAG: hypothetical protein B0D91_10560 [Oceanospirillales bacterium LUC14_002_19_P2]